MNTVRQGVMYEWVETPNLISSFVGHRCIALRDASGITKVRMLDRVGYHIAGTEIFTNTNSLREVTNVQLDLFEGV